MQSKLIIALAMFCLSAFVAASPIPAPAPVAAVHDFKFPRLESLAREESDVQEREPTCKYDCI
ncbi:hypothetical protein J3R30DRAFT_3719548 [Lentinula aciculospora]|uniref:Uncharacterized protein n=1 Tax=Lentinula aciculospora TaxID=153920 RepID=A0A9W9DF00_9AGAR|nr:hypothetical protein J3R30DRAFT_3719548 [Lentinula aciculospora]